MGCFFFLNTAYEGEIWMFDGVFFLRSIDDTSLTLERHQCLCGFTNYDVWKKSWKH